MDNNKIIDVTRLDHFKNKLVLSFEQGVYVPKISQNLQSWSERSSVEVTDKWDAVPVRTTAGNLSVNTAEGAHLVLIKSTGEFSASVFKASVFNLIITSDLVDGHPYVLVPKGVFGTFGTADENNGLLVTSSSGANVKAEMRFKPFEQGVPTHMSDGQVCPHVDSNGYRFYLPPSVGYIWSDDMTTSHCLHMAWSKDYDKYEVATAPSSINLSPIIRNFTKINNTYKMLSVSSDISDTITYSGDKFIWEKVCGYNDGSNWVTTQIGEDESSLYRHELTVSDIADNGIAMERGTANRLYVTGKTVWFEDEYSSADIEIVYQLATKDSGWEIVSNTYQPNDMGCEYIIGIQGSATIITTYMQDLPDELAATPQKLKSFIEDQTILTESLKQDILAIRDNRDNLGDLHVKSVDMDELPKVCGYQMFLFGTDAPTVTPDFIGQFFVDTTNGKVYMATAVTNASSFKLLN